MAKLPPELEDLVRAAAAPKQGTSNVWDRAAPGAVYRVDDKAVHFPQDPDRTPHTTQRRVIVVQSQVYSAGWSPRTILVVPCSASHQGAVSGYDFELPPNEKPFSGSRVVAYTSLVMPIAKAHFRQHCGAISEQALGEIQSRILRLLNLSLDEPNAPAASDVVEG